MRTRFFRFAAALFAGAALLVTGCTDFEADIQELNKRIDKLDSEKVASLESQLKTLQSTLALTYETIANHQTDLNGLRGEITSLLAAKLDKTTFEAFEASVAEARKILEGLQYADKDFVNQVAALLKDLSTLTAGDWTAAGVKYATVQEYIDGEIARLEGRLATAEKALEDLTKEGGVIDKIKQDIENLKTAKLDAADFKTYKDLTAITIGTMQSAINNLTALTAGFPEGKTIKDYIDGIAGSLDDYVLKTTFDSFVAIAATKEELLSLKSVLDGRLNALEALFTDFPEDKTVKEYIGEQISAIQIKLGEITNPSGTGRLDVLEDATATLTETVDKICEQIKFAEDYDGVYGKGLQGWIRDTEAEVLKAAKEYTADYIDLLVDQINDQLDDLYGYIDELRDRIQAIVFVPDYDDMKITVKVPSESTIPVLAKITYRILPTQYAAELADNYAELFWFDVKSVKTRSGEDPEMTIVGCDYDASTVNSTGLITFTVQLENFSSYNYAVALWLYRQESVRIDNDLNLKFTENELTSSYNTLYPVYVKTLNGYEYVEMGDGLKWATMNVGAENPEESGDYYAWGATATQSIYNWANYSFMETGKSNWRNVTKYTFDDGQKEGIWYDGDTFMGDNKDGVEHKNLASYDYVDDVARKNWGSTWRIPTDAEWTWLLDNCDWVWTNDYKGTGIPGRVVTSKVTGFKGNSIFLPAAGYWEGASLVKNKTVGGYWSSSLNDISDVAWIVGFNSEKIWGTQSRYYGMPIRPVSE